MRLLEVIFAHQRLERRAYELWWIAPKQDDDLRRNVGQDAAVVDRPVDIRCAFREKAK